MKRAILFMLGICLSVMAEAKIFIISEQATMIGEDTSTAKVSDGKLAMAIAEGGKTTILVYIGGVLIYNFYAEKQEETDSGIVMESTELRHNFKTKVMIAGGNGNMFVIFELPNKDLIHYICKPVEE